MISKGILFIDYKKRDIFSKSRYSAFVHILNEKRTGFVQKDSDWVLFSSEMFKNWYLSDGNSIVSVFYCKIRQDLFVFFSFLTTNENISAQIPQIKSRIEEVNSCQENLYYLRSHKRALQLKLLSEQYSPLRIFVFFGSSNYCNLLDDINTFGV